MRYYLDFEFDGFGGDWISLGLVREDNESIYIINTTNAKYAEESWVRENVVPILYRVPSPMPGMLYEVTSDTQAQKIIQHFLSEDESPVLIVDWPDDIKYFCELLITGPGKMISIPQIGFCMKRVDAYPTDVKDAVQHNAWWDAKALKRKIEL